MWNFEEELRTDVLVGSQPTNCVASKIRGDIGANPMCRGRSRALATHWAPTQWHDSPFNYDGTSAPARTTGSNININYINRNNNRQAERERERERENERKRENKMACARSPGADWKENNDKQQWKWNYQPTDDNNYGRNGTVDLWVRSPSATKSHALQTASIIHCARLLSYYIYRYIYFLDEFRWIFDIHVQVWFLQTCSDRLVIGKVKKPNKNKTVVFCFLF